MNTTSTPLPTLSAVHDFEDVVHRQALARFLSGEHPVGRELELSGVTDADSLVPLGSITRTVVSNSARNVLAEGDGWTARITRHSGGHVEASVSAVDAEVLAKLVAHIQASAPPAAPEADEVEVDFWFHSQRPMWRRRPIDAPRWDAIDDNYPAPVRTALSSLASTRPSTDDGRIILWFGPPGTGKTTAARALLRSWRPWCRGLFVTDPDQLFRDPGYLMTLLLDGDSGGSGDDRSDDDAGARWRMLVIEDADELVRADARAASGQALARLLNLADGMIGQGLRILVLLSTNAPSGGIHPAIGRPGRCLARTHFGRFDRREAQAWLAARADADAVGGAGAADPGEAKPAATLPAGLDFSLAELFRLAAGEPLDDLASPTATYGQYL